MNMRQRIRGNSGTTLLEMLVTLGILTLVCSILLALVNGSLTSYSSGASTAFANSSASIAIQKLENDIRDGATASVSGSTLTINFPATEEDGTTHEVLYSPGGTTTSRQYLMSSGNLVRRISGNDTILARSVTAVTFTATLGVVTATITTEEQVGAKTTQRTSAASIALRNYRAT